ncbi:hypothetical protein GWC77_27435 [Paraburkholderia sp. NMBU_R16]|uniref:hypothetical protein n=1 Tax=Paraburkholderia sp. NMBU_R16 TaxID=2698676 RepID=UPI0015673158|nr:hypothetical protein [Paraburkholderia sp. NMBU_R16]NRO99593.1 hypothetical protein [Paraburkholderia sp. NMBU_R16]
MSTDRLARTSGFELITTPAQAGRPAQISQARINALSFEVHPTIASYEGRIAFINRVAAEINSLSADLPITVLSLGSGRLLTEHLIHERLLKDKQRAVRWRCIDPMYASRRDNALEARRQFSAQKTNHFTFPSSTAYLGKESVFKQDRTGYVVILIADPPALRPEEESLLTPALRSSGMLIRGRSVPDIEECNTILVSMLNPGRQSEEHAQRTDASMRNGNLVFTNSSVKCQISISGRYIFQACRSEEAVAEALSKFAALEARQNSNRSSMTELNKIVDSFVREFNKDPTSKQVATKVVYSDYDRSVQELRQKSCLFDGLTVVAKFEKNKISVTKPKH